MSAEHIPVMRDEILELFRGKAISHFFDGTVGAGGHAEAILTEHPEIEMYIGCDRDKDALKIAKSSLEKWSSKVHFVHGSHARVKQWLQERGVLCVQGLLIDAGVSSMQLDRAERGFSFMREGPLDMRMDKSSRLTAAEIVNQWSEKRIAEILWEFGEESRARRIAKEIVKTRQKKQFCSTKDFVDAIFPHAQRMSRKHLHPATLTFQALRIAVNDELTALEEGIEKGIESLCPGGIIAILSFHRLEDRIAKNCFKAHEYKVKKNGDEQGCLDVLTKKPLVPQLSEVKKNPRSRSAKLRAGQKR